MQSIALILLLAQAGEPQRTQIYFQRPSGMKVYWLTKGQDGKTAYSKTPLEAPGRFNFKQGAVYRLKLTHLPGHPGLELFPTLEVAAVGSNAREFLDHNSVPLAVTEDDIADAVKGNLVVKVVYLPRGSEEPTSASGADAVRTAQQRGTVLLVFRLGNITDPSVK